MHISTAGLNLIKYFEGFRSSVYEDANGLPTIGYGHKLQPGERYPGGITEQHATTLLLNDATEAEAAVARLVKVALTQGQFGALVDFCFNLGQGRLASSTLLRDMNAGRYQEAAEQLLLWDHAGAKEIPGLNARREAEFKLWNQE